MTLVCRIDMQIHRDASRGRRNGREKKKTRAEDEKEKETKGGQARSGRNNVCEREKGKGSEDTARSNKNNH